MLKFGLFRVFGRVCGRFWNAARTRFRLFVLRGAALAVVGLAICSVALGPGGCVKLSPENLVCPEGTTLWMCTLTLHDHCACNSYASEAIQYPGCGTTAASAANDADEKLIVQLGSFGYTGKVMVWRLNNTVVSMYPVQCTDTGARGCGYGKVINCPPPYRTQGYCDPDPADDSCGACAKSTCCEQYQNCAGDSNCACWLSCKASGVDATMCASAAYCGAADAQATSLVACLKTSCAACSPASTGSSSSGGGSCSCGSSSSSSSSGAPACGQPDDLCGLEGEPPCCSGMCSLSLCN